MATKKGERGAACAAGNQFKLNAAMRTWGEQGIRVEPWHPPEAEKLVKDSEYARVKAVVRFCVVITGLTVMAVWSGQ